MLLFFFKFKNYLLHEAQNGPQVFFLLLQQAGYPPKHSPIPSVCITIDNKKMATIMLAT